MTNYAKQLEPYASLILGDNRASLGAMDADSVDSVVTDPPYHLTSIVDRFGKAGAAECIESNDGRYKRLATGFMGQEWDGGDIAQDPTFWREVWRALKPGGYLLAFSSARTAHRMACAIEDAGFELRDCVMWVYLSGFPKSHDVSGAVMRRAANEIAENAVRSMPNGGAIHLSGADVQKYTGFGSALKPAYEPIYMARKPFKGTIADNVLRYGIGAINIEACRIESGGESTVRESCSQMFSKNGLRDDTGRPALNRSSTGSDSGRWPSNVIIDESAVGAINADTHEIENISRFFYCSKASTAERNAGCDSLPSVVSKRYGEKGQGPLPQQTPHVHKPEGNHHPTVKNISLMRYLVRLVTPRGGLVLDPFCGSGSTGCAAVLEGMRFVGMDLSPDYLDISAARIAHWHAAYQPSIFTEPAPSETAESTQQSMFTEALI